MDIFLYLFGILPVFGAFYWYFRGTTEGHQGNLSSQNIPRTSTSSDPARATAFAVQSQTDHGGAGVLMAFSNEDLKDVKLSEFQNWFAQLEKEQAFEIKPEELSKLASLKISAEDARKILKEMNINLPSQIKLSNLSEVLSEIPELNPTQIQTFIEKMRKITKK